MSSSPAPPSEPRSSVSSDPSATSSHTLNSRYSGVHADNGEGSSTPSRASSVRPRNNASPEGHSTTLWSSSDTYLEQEHVEEQDFAHRQHRVRRSGGFLLHSAFPSPSGSGTPSASGQDGANVGDRHTLRPPSDASRVGRVRREKNRSSGSSPLSRELDITSQVDGNGGPREGNHDAENGQLRVAKMRNNRGGQAEDIQPAEDYAPPPRAAIDPNQIVNMALNLSESRKRNLSAGQLVVPSSPPPRRLTSAGQPTSVNNQRHGAGGSLRHHLQQQRRTSRNISPSTARDPSFVGRHVSTSSSRILTGPGLALQGLTFSPITIERRDQAKAYIELSMEYLRLLEHLPRLKPDASAPGNFVISSNNVPGTPQVDLSRVPSNANNKYPLGRPYNPLQYIRNRRTRARERKTLEHHSEEFEDVDRVKDWIDEVEKKAERPDYRQQDRVLLPKYHEDHAEKDPAPSKPARPRMGWVFSPAELLADAYWLEQNDNKSGIEDRWGNSIFAPKKQIDYLQPRSSKDYTEKRRKSWIEPIIAGASSEPNTGDESDGYSDRGRKRRLLISGLRGESSPGRPRKHGWRRTKTGSRTSSDTSDSENGSSGRKAGKPKLITSSDMNIGPLERHMREMLDKEAQEGGIASSPSVGSPDKWGEGYPIIANDMIGSEAGTSGKTSEKLAIIVRPDDDIPLPKNRPADVIITPDSGQEPRSSFEDLDTTEPNTPVLRKFLPSIGLDLSPPTSRRPSPTRKTKKSKFDIFRSDGSIKNQSLDPDSATDEHKRGSRQASGESVEPNGSGVAKISAPTAVKNLLLHKKNDSVGSLAISPEKKSRKDGKELKEAKEPSSAVTRFFKGGRIGELVRYEGSRVGDFIFKKDPPAEDSDSSSSSASSPEDSEEEEGDGISSQHLRPKPAPRTTTSGTASSLTGKKSARYHLELPTFRSATLPEQDDSDQGEATDSQIPDHHIYRQAMERTNSRSSRFSRLAPPPMDMSSISGDSLTPVQSRTRSPSRTRARLNAILERPGQVGRGGLPFTSLAKPNPSPSPSRHRSSSRPRLANKRHWSITDSSSPSRLPAASEAAISTADIARVRALLLCSGIKAREIARRAHAPRVPPPIFLTRAAQTAGAKLIPVSRKEEHVLAARILVRSLEVSTQRVHDAAEHFRNETCKALVERVSGLKAKVEEELFPRVRASGDEALAITGEVAGQAPLLFKGVSDRVDAMMRMRRRRMRWVRRVGWMLVEWGLLGVMWALWLIVVVVRLVRGVTVGVVRGVRWFLWI
ncbi:hypothetical protein BU16DRAFT_477671 [Lophium mytilinum]|uniref:Uncharacterized protein n=1 Tax=Lophium mytilinum TaxID=390894 RepID=A0A6A6RDF5_9PEZI|nr:hypothetical protein BU16DRAFT_477671 [Lophium mytilinum]